MEPVAGVFPLVSQRLRGLVLATGDTSVDSVAGVFPRPGQRPGGLVLATVDLKNFHFGAADLLRRPLADKFLHVAIVPANAYQRTKLQLSSSISFRDKEGVPKFNVGATSPLPYLYAETFMCAQSTWQDQTACQVSASYRYASCSEKNNNLAIANRSRVSCAHNTSRASA